MSTFVKNIGVICERKAGSAGMPFTVKDIELRARAAKESAAHWIRRHLPCWMNQWRSHFSLTATRGQLRVKNRPSSYHTAICPVHLGSSGQEGFKPHYCKYIYISHKYKKVYLTLSAQYFTWSYWYFSDNLNVSTNASICTYSFFNFIEKLHFLRNVVFTWIFK